MQPSLKKLSQLLETPFHHTVDFIYAKIPQPFPDKGALQRAKIITHRGQHDNISVLENTLPAFDKAEKHGVWGMECDVRWTKDLVPVVFHDMDLNRIFGESRKISQMSFKQIRNDFPQIPCLVEVLRRYEKKMHFMVEIKSEPYPDPNYQSKMLSEAFSGLTPGEDFHFLSLSPHMFQFVDFVPKSTHIAVAQLNLKEMSSLSLEENYGGIAGHYLFITQKRLTAHQQRNQNVGTAYIRSQKSLFREINRGADWIFSNHACQVQDIITGLIHS